MHAWRADRDVLVAAIFVLVAALLLQVTPDREGITAFGWRLPESCAFKQFAGDDCPGCGLTRSFVLGVRGDTEAFRLHALGPLLLVTLLVQIPYRAFRLRRLTALRRQGLIDLGILDWKRFWSLYRFALIGALISAWAVGIYLRSPS